MAGVTTDSSPDPLTPLQRDLLDSFFELEQRFALTGGAALAGFHLRHRVSQDLDRFRAALVVELRRRALPGGGPAAETD